MTVKDTTLYASFLPKGLLDNISKYLNISYAVDDVSKIGLVTIRTPVFINSFSM